MELVDLTGKDDFSSNQARGLAWFRKEMKSVAEGGA
jgi:hypothetical protein